MTRTEIFFAQHPVFSLREFREALGAANAEQTVRNKLSYSVNRGRLCKVGQGGIYCVVPPGQPAAEYVPNRFLVASKLRPDAVIAYHSAFEFTGRANQVFTTTYYTSARYKPPLEFRGTTYRCILQRERERNSTRTRADSQSPRTPEFAESAASGLLRERMDGMEVTVTGPEYATLACLDRPLYGGGWGEICRCVVSLPMLDTDWILFYLRAIAKPTLAAKVGYLLEAYRERFYVRDTRLKEIEELAPRGPVKLNRKQRGIFVSRWNLVVPRDLAKAVEDTR